MAEPRLKLQVRLMCGGEVALGPGKADLLDAIARAGSISGAGRALGMSYRRAWDLVDAMNRCFATPLVETATGGPAGGGARLTESGRAMLASCRALERELLAASDGAALAAITAALRPEPLAKKG